MKVTKRKQSLSEYAVCDTIDTIEKVGVKRLYYGAASITIKGANLCRGQNVLKCWIKDR